MPKWGLTQEQIESRPWGLKAEYLRPDKIITNSVQGDVYITQLERLFIDTPPMQRLRRVRQLGTTHLVYPDATHTRFSHSLGTLRSVQDLLDVVLDQQNRRDPQEDLFKEWRDKDPESYTRRVAEVIVLARLGALLHDLCHVPFGHTIEDDLGLLESHDRNRVRFERLWAQMPDEPRDLVSRRLLQELHRLIISKGERRGPKSDYPFVADLVGNTICADLLDYLERDHRHLGLPLELGHRFLEGLYVTTSDHPHKRQRVVVELHRAGEDRSDVLSELLKYLRYRYEEGERALTHHTKLAADSMIGKLLAMWRDAVWVDSFADLLNVPTEVRKDVDETRRWVEAQPGEDLVMALERMGQPDPGPQRAQALIAAVDAQVTDALEEALTTHGDDGLLESILTESARATNDSRREAIVELCRGLLGRRLYKRIGRSMPIDRDLAESLWGSYGPPDLRRRLELEAAEFLGLEEKWHLVLWVPSPRMGLKVADVLVGGGTHVSTLHQYSAKVREIYDSHQDLWAVGVYVHPLLQQDELKCDVLLAWLRSRLGLRGWTRAETFEDWRRVAIKHFAAIWELTPGQQENLLRQAALGGGRTLGEFLAALEAMVKRVESS